ncbi:hypothetical protein EDF62_0570 [Leucobacter luti]|uniref:Uncharacterized protein n=1 Tax=Leucobacter luti TaxID=340320 RepID=A0A4R6SA93_9MICO|nr:DUF6264 family protein [Leucobacter luti]TDP95876.1 hypothetical protein EDF62_0570 [Leucobacter luti]
MAEQPTDPTQEGAAPSAPPAQSSSPAQPAPRPAQPAYGEYAPEGWSWKPEGAADDPASNQTTGQSTAPAAPHTAAAPPAGVPHNLGAPARPAAEQQAAGAPYRAAAPQAPAQPQTPAQPQNLGSQGSGQLPPAYRVPGPKGPRIGDRVVTILLLALGAFGALNIASSFFNLEAQIRLTGTMIGVDSPQLASWVGPLGIISGLVVLLLFALTLIFSIQRMRANKLTFWVPLVAGVVAVIILMIVPMIAMSGAPDIMQQLESDPTGSLDKMMDYLTQLQQP